MKVYIFVDSEGQACITREPSAQTVYGTFQAEYNRRRATDETIAAVEGARAGGASEVIVHDAGFIRGHTPTSLTLHYDDLPRGIRIVLGGATLRQVAPEGFDAAFLIGAHARAGTTDGVMAHTFSSVTIRHMTLNGKAVGEIELHALQFGAFGIPVVMVAGDEAGCREAAECLGDVERAPVKRGLSTHAAVSLHPRDADELIGSAARTALQRIAEFRPYEMEGPFELRVDCFTAEQARSRAERKGGIFVAPAGYVVRSNTPLDLT
jgi:D-amino peptidase